ncbi:GntR family transcriptional regulator [Streptomyces sp. NPDC047072]|uniref:GntR family transcriptional regulator n=1 Tax=Streptomyces sp. NPDC047072 TaxID=3154809 RepID=UPI0033E65F3E
MPSAEGGERTPSLYLQVAQHVASDIKRHRYTAGAFLPSETAMMKTYGVGRHTVRSAIGELRRMGLVESLQGRGTRVLPAKNVLLPVGLDRSAQLSPIPPDATSIESPVVCRGSLEGPPAVLLGQQDQEAISVSRTLYDAATGVLIHHRAIIPAATAADVPSLAEADVRELYRRLAEAGFSLAFVDHVTARTAHPDERTTFGLSNVDPLLVTYRVTSDADHGRLLMCEELKTPATSSHLMYPVTPTEAA